MASEACEGSDRLVTAYTLRERGWTPTLIRRFLDPPDMTKPNPHYRKAAPMKLYADARARAIEASAPFTTAAASAAKRAAAASAVADRKRQELVAAAEAMTIRVEQYPPDRLLRAAIDSYNRRTTEEYGRDGFASPKSDGAFLERIQVNFIRHELTSYDEALEANAAKPGVGSANATIQRRVYAAIAAAYPQFDAECTRQLILRQSK